MWGFLAQLAIGLITAAASALFGAKPKAPEPPKPQKSDYGPTADEGTEILHHFGTGPTQFLVVWVGDKSIEAIVR